MTIRKAVIPVAGLGTRFLPATKAVPKELIPIVDKPIIQYVVEEAVSSGIEQIVLVTSQGKRAIEDYFDRHLELERRLEELGRSDDLELVRRPSQLAEFVFVRQAEPKGNGHAVLCARAAVGDEPFALIWGDDIIDATVPCLRQMMDVHHRYGGAVAAAMRIDPDQASSYGVVDGERVEDRVYRVRRMVEKPTPGAAPSNLAVVHAWVLPPRIFPILAATPPGRNGEIWLVDAIGTLLEEMPIYALEFEGHFYDTGSRLELLQASIDFALRRPDLAPALRQYLRGVMSEE